MGGTVSLVKMSDQTRSETKDTSLLGLLCFTSFGLAILNKKASS